MRQPRHVLVVANETVAGRALIDALRERVADGPIRVTVICPQNAPRAGLVVYDESRASSAERRLQRTLDLLHREGIAARGAVVDPDPLEALRDALHELRPDEVIVSTHPQTRSGWLRRDLVERARGLADVPVEHVVVDLDSPQERAHVLVLANQTMLGDVLLDTLRERAALGAADFALVAPADVPGAHERLEAALERLHDEGLEASGRIGDPDPFTAVLNLVGDERVDEIVVSTLPRATSGWLRRDLVVRLERATGLPVRHVVAEPVEARP